MSGFPESGHDWAIYEYTPMSLNACSHSTSGLRSPAFASAMILRERNDLVGDGAVADPQSDASKFEGNA
jgi:hypothetical protein